MSNAGPHLVWNGIPGRDDACRRMGRSSYWMWHVPVRLMHGVSRWRRAGCPERSWPGSNRIGWWRTCGSLENRKIRDMRKLIFIRESQNLPWRVLGLTPRDGFISDAPYSSEIHACGPAAAFLSGCGPGVLGTRIC